ncbi:hypothetical protein [Kribbella sp. NPDC049227]
MPSYDDHGYTYNPADVDELAKVSGHRTFRQVATAGWLYRPGS